MNMHKSRNLTTHTYDEQIAEEILDSIHNDYFNLLKDLLLRLQKEEEALKEHINRVGVVLFER